MLLNYTFDALLHGQSIQNVEIERKFFYFMKIFYNKPVAATMCIGPKGDTDGVQPEECAVR